MHKLECTHPLVSLPRITGILLLTSMARFSPEFLTASHLGWFWLIWHVSNQKETEYYLLPNIQNRNHLLCWTFSNPRCKVVPTLNQELQIHMTFIATCFLSELVDGQDLDLGKHAIKPIITSMNKGRLLLINSTSTKSERLPLKYASAFWMSSGTQIYSQGKL